MKIDFLTSSKVWATSSRPVLAGYALEWARRAADPRTYTNVERLQENLEDKVIRIADAK